MEHLHTHKYSSTITSHNNVAEHIHGDSNINTNSQYTVSSIHMSNYHSKSEFVSTVDIYVCDDHSPEFNTLNCIFVNVLFGG